MWVAGPGAGGILADWGADVIKIEPPTGDPARTFGGMLGGDGGTNPPFDLDNRSKRSIALDLSTPDGREIVHELIAGADVFLTNIRLDALGAGGARRRTSSPRATRGWSTRSSRAMASTAPTPTGGRTTSPPTGRVQVLPTP